MREGEGGERVRQYITKQYSTIQYSTVQHSTLLHYGNYTTLHYITPSSLDEWMDAVASTPVIAYSKEKEVETPTNPNQLLIVFPFFSE